MVVTSEEIQAMSYAELREQCRNAGLTSSGKTDVLRKRLRGHIAATTQNNGNGNSSSKRQKRCVEDDLICPITLELPYDPVMAEDGRVYERYAIEKYFHGKKNSRRVKSPMTSELIGKKLIAAPQIKNHIQTLVDDEIITGELAEKWNLHAIHNELLQKAKGGDLTAMEQVANNFAFGLEGVVKDRRKAGEWFAKAHALGSVMGTAWTGERLAKSDDPQKSVKGVCFLTSAAERGSNWAAYKLGLAFFDSLYNLAFDAAEATKWLGRCLDESCEMDHLNDQGREIARAKLAELEAMQNNGQRAA